MFDDIILWQHAKHRYGYIEFDGRVWDDYLKGKEPTTRIINDVLAKIGFMRKGQEYCAHTKIVKIFGTCPLFDEVYKDSNQMRYMLHITEDGAGNILDVRVTKNG